MQTFIYYGHCWVYELSEISEATGLAVLTVKSQKYDDDPGAGSHLTKSAFYQACHILDLKTAGEIQHSGGWAQCSVEPAEVEEMAD